MLDTFQTPADATYWVIQGRALFLLIHVLGTACFAYIVARRLAPLIRAERDFRFDRLPERLGLVLKYWLGQWRHPRYRVSGIVHILIFAGFILLAARAFSLILGFYEDGGPTGELGQIYARVTEYATTIVFFCMVFAALRRVVFKPARYAVPARHGKAHTTDAIFLLALIALLMLADSFFEASKAVAEVRLGNSVQVLGWGSLPWILQNALATTPVSTLQRLHLGSYLVHDLTFFFLLCYRPFGIQFHVETSLFTIFFAKLDRENLKPVRWGVGDGELDQVKSVGVKTFEDFTWKHILDFCSCADCGRCSDNCPANAVGRPLSPRFLTIKARDYCFTHYPVLGHTQNGTPLIGNIFSADEVWSCTTCGACEQECPLLVEYVDKIVDLRRGMVDNGNVPQSLQKPLRSLESRGNPYGKVEKKRADWTKADDFPKTCEVRIANGGGKIELLYFVDSITSYDDRMQSIARAAARMLKYLGEDFAILGPAEQDSGHEVRRFGEESLFMALRDRNLQAINTTGANRIVVTDPHALNALKHDYSGLPPVEHISQVIASKVKAGKIKFHPVENGSVYTYHDPCYLGRHNQVYDDPRDVLDSIPNLKRVEMRRSRDRSFCCGGGGLMLFYEPKEDERMGVKRVQMAAEAGANVVVTACPFCLANIEDAIKVAGMEGTMRAMDLVELAHQQIAKPNTA